jgi:hypothetical protein
MSNIRVIVRYSKLIVPKVETWTTVHPPDRENRQALLPVYEEIFQSEIEKAGGYPAVARLKIVNGHPTYWMMIDGRTWIQFVIKPSKMPRMFRDVREVVILDITEHPPDSVR